MRGGVECKINTARRHADDLQQDGMAYAAMVSCALRCAALWCGAVRCVAMPQAMWMHRVGQPDGAHSMEGHRDERLRIELKLSADRQPQRAIR